MISYETYIEMGGKATEDNFNALLPIVATQLINYIYNKIPFWRLDCVDLNANELYAAFVTQINYLDANSYLDTQYDQLDGISSVQTDGFTISYGGRNSDQSNIDQSDSQKAAAQLYLDVRLSIDTYLRKRGLMYRGFYCV